MYYMVIVWVDEENKKFTATARRYAGARLKDLEDWCDSKKLKKAYSQNYTTKEAAEIDKKNKEMEFLHKGYKKVIRGDI